MCAPYIFRICLSFYAIYVLYNTKNGFQINSTFYHVHVFLILFLCSLSPSCSYIPERTNAIQLDDGVCFLFFFCSRFFKGEFPQMPNWVSNAWRCRQIMRQQWSMKRWILSQTYTSWYKFNFGIGTILYMNECIEWIYSYKWNKIVFLRIEQSTFWHFLWWSSVVAIFFQINLPHIRCCRCLCIRFH